MRVSSPPKKYRIVPFHQPNSPPTSNLHSKTGTDLERFAKLKIPTLPPFSFLVQKHNPTNNDLNLNFTSPTISLFWLNFQKSQPTNPPGTNEFARLKQRQIFQPFANQPLPTNTPRTSKVCKVFSWSMPKPWESARFASMMRFLGRGCCRWLDLMFFVPTSLKGGLGC